jgi:hypothetical protein
MNTIEQDHKRLHNLYKAYLKTEGVMKNIWKKKWYELVHILSIKNNHAKIESWRGKQH